MPGKIERKNTKKILIVGLISLVVGGGIGFHLYQKTKPSDSNIEVLSEDAQKSLIELETGLVKNNTKPKEVIADLSPRLSKLNNQNKYLATDLMYTSVQNAAFYYNSTAQIMSGEVDYNRKDSENALDAAKNSAWVDGYIKDIKDQYLVPQSLSPDFILTLPDFDKLSTFSDNYSEELKTLVNTGKNIQNLNVFQDGKVSPTKAFEAYKLAILGVGELSSKNPSSKYIADMTSLARLYHDIALGLVQTPNISLEKDGTYKLTDSQISALKEFEKDKAQTDLSKEAGEILKEVKDGKVKAEVLKDKAKLSQKEFGSSVYWQGATDLESAVTKQVDNKQSKN